MKLIEVKNYEEMSEKAAALVGQAVAKKANSVLGLATGSTPVGMYQRLADAHNAGKIKLSNICGVNLDEYIGIGGDHELSYRYFMSKNFYSLFGFDESRAHIPNGLAPDLVEECARYDALIEELGGIDLQVLGIGRNGHIGFNEPDDVFIKNTHIAELDADTRAANARFFDSLDDVPSKALTMGIGAIMAAKEILLLVSGSDKAQALKEARTGDINPRLPASILQLHPNVTVIADEAALQK